MSTANKQEPSQSANYAVTPPTTESQVASGSKDLQDTLGNDAIQSLVAHFKGEELLKWIMGGGTLEEGSKGTAVEELQLELGFPKADGVLGAGTAHAIKMIQGLNGIPETGVVNLHTLVAIANNWDQDGENDILFQHQTYGGSKRSRKQTNTKTGRQASEAMAKEDTKRVMRFASLFEIVGKEYNFPAALLAAICSRETRGGNLINDEGWSIFDGQGFGLMQVDINSHVPEGDPYSIEHMRQAARILSYMRKYIAHKHKDWSEPEVLRGAVAAYNAGPGRIKTVSGMDGITTGKDYSSDTWTRAQYYARFFADSPESVAVN